MFIIKIRLNEMCLDHIQRPSPPRRRPPISISYVTGEFVHVILIVAQR